ncbi:RlpA-like double-psi beta-barrel-protein domain-containing protein-containing protein [Mycena crocata]|nr:RlpA-like double-psi beta-barrel-protein domain-containing protein-containing protein [Mycena crocata]
MFSLASFTVLALAVASVSAHSISHVRRHRVPRAQPPVGWATSYLEEYDVYHSRYMAIGCENKHNTSFFDFCCHPLLAKETVKDNRPACCAVGATAACPGATASSSAAAPASSADLSNDDSGDEEEEDCDDDDEDTSNDNTSNENTNDDDEEDCEDEEDEPATVSSSKVAGTPKATTTPKAATSSRVAAVTPSTTPKTTARTTAEETTSTHTTAKAETTKKATTTTTASTPDKTPSSSVVKGGFGTWFTQNGVAGACGKVHKDTDFVVALETKTYAKGINCGRKIRITNPSNGKSSDAIVADECPTCDNTESVDMSKKLFESLAALSVGEFPITWQFLD